MLQLNIFLATVENYIWASHWDVYSNQKDRYDENKSKQLEQMHIEYGRALNLTEEHVEDNK